MDDPKALVDREGDHVRVSVRLPGQFGSQSPEVKLAEAVVSALVGHPVRYVDGGNGGFVVASAPKS